MQQFELHRDSTLLDFLSRLEEFEEIIPRELRERFAQDLHDNYINPEAAVLSTEEQSRLIQWSCGEILSRAGDYKSIPDMATMFQRIEKVLPLTKEFIENPKAGEELKQMGFAKTFEDVRRLLDRLNTQWGEKDRGRSLARELLLNVLSSIENRLSTSDGHPDLLGRIKQNLWYESKEGIITKEDMRKVLSDALRQNLRIDPNRTTQVRFGNIKVNSSPLEIATSVILGKVDGSALKKLHSQIKKLQGLEREAAADLQIVMLVAAIESALEDAPEHKNEEIQAAIGALLANSN